MISPTLSATLQAFDDQALATLANAGLLRRAQRDVADGKAALVSSSGDSAQLDIDGQNVTIDVAGPAKADCDCPAMGVCRHRIAAVLFLRDIKPALDQSEPVEAEAAAGPAPDEPPQSIIGGISLADAQKFAGKPGWRAAQELLEEASLVEAAAQSIAVHFGGLDDPVLILRGQGMAGIVSKASKARAKAYHAAAYLAARRYFDLPVAEEADDETLAEPSKPAERVDAAFVARVESALGDCVHLGFNLAPVSVEESLFALSVSSRADALPRLASLLRAIAAQMRLRRQRSFDYDPDRMLELVALAFALCRFAAHSPATAAARADNHTEIMGELRRDYQPFPDTELIGCGAHIWRSRAGARGVTGFFLDLQTGQIYSTSLARGPGQDPSFNARLAFRQQSLWHAAPLERLVHARILLRQGLVSSDGRLSAAQQVRATVLESGSTPPPTLPCVQTDWRELEAELGQRCGLGLTRTGQPVAMLLAPSDNARPQFDELAQRLVWPLRDRNGQWVAATIAHDEYDSRALEALEDQLKSGWKGHLLAEVGTSGERYEITPITLFSDKGPVDLSASERRGVLPESAGIRAWLNRLRPDPGHALTIAADTASQRALGAAWRHLLDRLEAGPRLARLLDTERTAHARRLADYGLGTLSELVGQCDDETQLMHVAYALVVARHQRTSLPYLA